MSPGTEEEAAARRAALDDAPRAAPLCGIDGCEPHRRPLPTGWLASLAGDMQAAARAEHGHHPGPMPPMVEDLPARDVGLLALVADPPDDGACTDPECCP